MKFSWHTVGQVLLTLLQILNFESGVVPPKYMPFVTAGLSIIQGLLALYNHFFNPDGTPAAVSWTGGKS
jgi:hypothetical protein